MPGARSRAQLPHGTALDSQTGAARRRHVTIRKPDGPLVSTKKDIAGVIHPRSNGRPRCGFDKKGYCSPSSLTALCGDSLAGSCTSCPFQGRFSS